MYPNFQGFDNNNNLKSGVKINDLKSVEDSLPGSLVPETYTGSEYPRYDYLRGFVHQGDQRRFDGLFLNDNVRVDDFQRVLKDISESTGPFVALVSRDFETLDSVIMGETLCDKFVLYAYDGECECETVDDPLSVTSLEQFVHDQFEITA